MFLSIMAAFVIGSMLIAAAPQVEKTREVEKTRDVDKWVEKSRGFIFTKGETWVSANTFGYKSVIIDASKKDYHIKGYIKVLTEGDTINFEILDVKNFDLRKHHRSYEKEFAIENIKEINYTWYPSKKEDLWYFCLDNNLPWDVKVFWEAKEYWKELETVKEKYTITETYYESAQPYAGIGALLLYSIVMFPVWALMRWRHHKSIRSLSYLNFLKTDWSILKSSFKLSIYSLNGGRVCCSTMNLHLPSFMV